VAVQTMLVHGLSRLKTPHKTDVESAFLLFWLFWSSSRSGLGSSLKFCGSLVAVSFCPCSNMWRVSSVRSCFSKRLQAVPGVRNVRTVKERDRCNEISLSFRCGAPNGGEGQPALYSSSCFFNCFIDGESPRAPRPHPDYSFILV